MISLPFDPHGDAELAGGAAHQEAGTTIGEVGMATARLQIAGAERADVVFERPRDAVGLDHQHRNAEGLGPAAPVGGDIAEIMGNQQRNAELRVGMVEFERDGHLAVAMVDGAGGDTLEDTLRQGNRERQAAGGKDFAQDRAAFVYGDADVIRTIMDGVADLLREAGRIETQRRASPSGLQNGIVHFILPLSYLRAGLRSSPRDFSSSMADNRRAPFRTALKMRLRKTLPPLMGYQNRIRQGFREGERCADLK